jgi:uncharacterized protein
MQYRKLGRTGVELSVLGFGGMRIPQRRIGGNLFYDDEAGLRIMRRAFELGVNYVDTAPYYCDGESEIIIGKALKGWRDKVYLSTKNPIEDASGQHWRARLENSLKKLDTDYIDFYHMWGIDWDHFANRIIVKDGPMQEAIKAKQEGLIRHHSFSFHDIPENMIRIIDYGFFETVLCQYNLLDQSNTAAMDYAVSKGLGVIIMGPIGGGRLSAPSETIRNILPGKVNSSAEIALRFVFANKSVTCALSGMSSVEQVEENVRVASNSAELTAGELAQISASLAENKKLADLYCTGCNYCMPCPNGVNIPLNFKLMNYHRVYQITEFARSKYKLINPDDEDLPGRRADECTECGLCEEKCPQKIPIRKQLKETAEVLG